MDRILKILIIPIMLAPAIYLGIIWNKLPDTVPVHFGINGEPDRFGSKSEVWVAVLILGAVGLFSYFLVSNIYRIDPKKKAFENKERLQRLAFIISTFMSITAILIIYGTYMGTARFSARLILIGVGLLFCFMGNYFHTIKPNYFAGIRLPWTLENEENWRKTHLITGKLFFIGGIVIALIALFLPPVFAAFSIMGITLLIIVYSVVYSYKLYKRQKMTSK